MNLSLQNVISNVLENCKKNEVIELIEKKGFDPFISMGKKIISINEIPLKILQDRFFNPTDIVLYFKIINISYLKTPYNRNNQIMNDIKLLLRNLFNNYKEVIKMDFHNYIHNYQALCIIIKYLKLNIFEGLNINNLSKSINNTLVKIIFNYWSKTNYSMFLNILKLGIQIYNQTHTDKINYIESYFKQKKIKNNFKYKKQKIKHNPL